MSISFKFWSLSSQLSSRYVQLINISLQRPYSIHLRCTTVLEIDDGVYTLCECGSIDFNYISQSHDILVKVWIHINTYSYFGRLCQGMQLTGYTLRVVSGEVYYIPEAISC